MTEESAAFTDISSTSSQHLKKLLLVEGGDAYFSAKHLDQVPFAHKQHHKLLKGRKHHRFVAATPQPQTKQIAFVNYNAWDAPAAT